MKEKFLAFLRKLNNPPAWAIVLNYAVTLLSVIASLVTLAVESESMLFAVITYLVYAVAAVSLSYTVYTLVKCGPQMKKRVTDWIDGHTFTRTLRENFGFRTVVFAVGSFALGVVYSVFNGVLGVVYRSIWYGAFAAYYILLTFLRGGILLYHKNKSGEKIEDEEFLEARKYRACGVILLILNVALSSAIAQMIFSDRFFEYPGWTIYAYAAFAFYKITMAIVNLFKAKKQDDLTVQALRDTNLIAAAVSLLALQTALLYTFSSAEVNVSLFNTLTGTAVSLFSVAMSIFMIVKGQKTMRSIRTEKKEDGEQGE